MQHLSSNNVEVHDYDLVDSKIQEYANLLKDKRIVLDSNAINYHLYNLLKTNSFTISNLPNVPEHLKAKKSEVQQEGMRQCNIRDCAAIMKYFAFLEQ